MIEPLRRSGEDASILTAESQLQVLSRLRRRLDHASPTSLAALRAEVVSLVAATQLFTSPAMSQTSSRDALQQADDAARSQVQGFLHDYYERRIFDPYLRFASAEDEEAYRRREAERKAQIEKAQAEGTPQGDLRAMTLAIEQTKDAGAHGANRSPEYAPMLTKLAESQRALEAATGTSAPTSKPKDEQQTAPAKDAALAGISLSADMLAQLQAVGIKSGVSSAEGHGLAGLAVNSSSRGLG